MLHKIWKTDANEPKTIKLSATCRIMTIIRYFYYVQERKIPCQNLIWQ